LTELTNLNASINKYLNCDVLLLFFSDFSSFLTLTRNIVPGIQLTTFFKFYSTFI